MATDENRRQYEDEGYFVLDEGVTAAELAQLRAICDRYITEYDTSAAVPEPEGAAGGDPEMQLRIMPDGRTFRTNIVNRKGYRYHLAGHYFDDPALRELMRGPRMAEICMATLGPEAFVYYDQFTVKGPEGADTARDDGSAGIAEGRCSTTTSWLAIPDDRTSSPGTRTAATSRRGTRCRLPRGWRSTI